MTPVWVVGLLLFIVGACVGSFLNVVVYRLPRRESLLRPASRCPACGHAIRWHDNTPIVGWLWLRGRCRDCRTPISPRYPWVEALVGALFVCVGGAVIARIAEGDSEGAIRAAISAAPSLWLLCVLLAAAFMEHDGMNPPEGMFLFAALVVLVTFPFWAPANWSSAQLISRFVAAVIGAGFGRLLRGDSQGSARVLEFVLIGVVLGLLPLLVIAVVATAARYLAMNVWSRDRRPEGLAAWLTAVTFFWIMSWPWISPFVDSFAGHWIPLT